MKFEWSLREEILATTHRWPILVMVFLVGVLVGWGVSKIIPSDYRAETTLFVSYNADAIFRNPDDYKNWHMGQLNALAIAPDVIRATLTRLREMDPAYWNNVHKKVLEKSLSVQWRNTGTWRLIAKNDSSERATQALETWKDVFLKTYQHASTAAKEMNLMESQLYPLNIAGTEARTRQAELSATKEGLLAWQESVAPLPQNDPLDLTTHWRAWSLVSRAAAYDVAWKSLLDNFPLESDPLADYLSWIEKAIISIDTEMGILQAQIDEIEPERLLVSEGYLKALEKSRGLSAHVHVEGASDPPPTVTPSRQEGISALIGGMVALLIYLLVWSARLTAKALR